MKAPEQFEEPSAVFDDIGSIDGQPCGQLNKIVASILMRILYVARMARFELLRVTCRLATKVPRWTEQCDKQLLRLVRYIWHHRGERQVGFIGNDISEMSLRFFNDDDFAGDVASRRSIGGVHLALHWSHSSNTTS